MNKSNADDKDNYNNNDAKTDSNIFFIMDEIIDQLNKTKKLFIIMLLTIMIIPPIGFMISFMLFGFPFYENPSSNFDSSSTSASPFQYFKLIPLIIVLIWLGIGIRQWRVLSKWGKKYQKYKELQNRIDDELGKEDKSESK